MVQLPSGTVTFLFSDVEGSTQLLERHGAAMGVALARHHALFEETVERHGGAIFETVGDAVYAAFSRASAAVSAALDAHRALAAEDWGPIERLAVRIALHSGAVEQRGDHYFGAPLFRTARLQVLGYGEQTLLSGVTAGMSADALPAGASLRHLGTHRLKDLGQPEQVYQLVHPELRAEFPALKSLDAHPHNLPLQLSSFIGREAELGDLRQLLGKHRHVTLLGPGGIGKTRLALQAAAEAIDAFADGVFFVDLAAVRDPELAPGAIATSLGLREQPGQPIRATLAEHLGSRRLLLVLDNLEQLLPAAATTVAELLTEAPELRVLATSRATLRIRGEQEYSVPTLAAGDPRRLEDEPPPAVALFVERARAIRPDLAIDEESGPLIAAICARLDGLPLAIELAASRLRLFSLAALSERLKQRLPLLSGGARDLPERQRTLRAAIAWSEELLRGPEQRLFARLGVFVGGFTLEAAEAVAGADVGGDVLEALSALLEQSLVRQDEGVAGEPRYAMLETIREYALERLSAASEAEATRHAHGDYYLSLAERARAEIDGPKQQAWYRRLDQDVGNLRAAMDSSETTGLGEQLLRFGPALYPYWASRALLQDFRHWADEAGQRLHDATSRIQADALHAIAFARAVDGDLSTAETMYAHAATARRELGDLDGAASSLNNLGTIHLDRGNYAAAERFLRECLVIQPGSPEATVNLGECALQLGKDAEAQQLFVEALRIFRERGDEESEIYALSSLGRLALAQGDIEAASHLCADARRLNHIHGNQNWAHFIDMDEARLLMQTGQVSEAVALAIGALEYVHDLGVKQGKGTADALDLLAEAALRSGEPAVAGRLWGAVESFLQTSGFSLGPRRKAERSELIDDLATMTSLPSLTEGLIQGRSLGIESAVRLVRATLGPAA
jgi:predicted ATPase/class 3 adenylate cyclase/Flp pilus assembly protein TadD